MTTSWAALFERAEARAPSGASDGEAALDSIRDALARRRADGADGGEEGG